MTAIRSIKDAVFPFKSYFNTQTGEYLRTGLFDEVGFDTGVDAFQASFPHLLDIGIMGHCLHGLSGRCKQAGNLCYQSGSSIDQENMSLQDFKFIAEQCKGKVFQFALGGRGDPDQHEQFADILAASRQFGIVPNLTTSGFGLDEAKARLIAQYCGAAAVSWYRQDYTQRAIDLLLSAGVKTNLHFVLSPKSLEEAIDLLENEHIPAGINRIVFLLFKPIGQGQGAQILPFDDRTRHFFSLMDTPYGLAHSGFDSCSVPGVLNSTYRVDPNCFDACEAARYSAYITPDLDMVPCSFDQNRQWRVSLRTHSIQTAWDGFEFEQFRSRQKQACPECAKRDLCYGGCPIAPEITLCNETRRKHSI